MSARARASSVARAEALFFGCANWRNRHTNVSIDKLICLQIDTLPTAALVKHHHSLVRESERSVIGKANKVKWPLGELVPTTVAATSVR